MKRLFLCVAQVVILLVSMVASAQRQNDKGRFVVLFNQPKYASGDTVYFTVFTTDDRAPEKCVVNLRLLDKDQALIINERFLLHEGTGYGQFKVPGSAQPGRYNLVLITENGLISGKPRGDIAHFIIVGKNELQHDALMHRKPGFDTSRIQLDLNSKRYNTREKVTVTIRNLKPTRPAKVAITVYKSDLLSGSPLVATSSLSNEDASTTAQPRFAIPYYFAGRAFFEQTSLPVPASSRITFFLSESDLIYSVHTKKDGYFSFPMFKNFSTENIFYTISNNGTPITDYKIEIFRPQIEVAALESAYSSEADRYWLYARQKAVVDNAYAYRRGIALSEERVGSDFEFDHEVMLDNLGPFATMEEVLVNVVPMAKPRNGGIRIFLKKDAKYASSDPIYIVDGIMTDETGWVLSLDPEKIKRMAVLRSPRTLLRFGELGRNGILVIETTSGTDPDIFAKNITMQGLIKPAITWHNAEPSQTRMPILRPSLYWHADRLLENEISFDFYTADDVGTYTIFVTGLDEEGYFVKSVDLQVVSPGSN